MRKPDTLDGSLTPSQWWKHLKEYKRAVHKAERANWKKCIKNASLAQK